MPELEEHEPTTLILWEGGSDNGSEDADISEEAPYGYKKDGTPAKKRGRKAGSSGTSSSPSRSGSRSNLEREIYEALGGDIAATVGTVAPLVAYVIDERAERTAKALASIAKRSPNFAKGIERILVYRDFLTLASLPPALAVAGMVEFGMIKPDSSMSRRFGLYDPWLAMYGDNGTELPPEYVQPAPMGLLAGG